MEKDLGFLNENNGQRSMTRVVFLVGSVWAMALTTFLAVTGTEPGILIAVFGSLQGTYVGLKLGQKPMENNAKK
jgi:hypothetical protein